MLGSVMIGIVTGMAAAAVAVISGYGLLAGLGIYALSGAVATLAAALLSLRNATQDTASAPAPSCGFGQTSQ